MSKKKIEKINKTKYVKIAFHQNSTIEDKFLFNSALYHLVGEKKYGPKKSRKNVHNKYPETRWFAVQKIKTNT